MPTPTFATVGEFNEDYPSNERKSDELLLFLDNEAPIYSRKLAVARALGKRIKAGSYDHRLAPQAWAHVANDAAKRYAREMGPSESAYSKMFPAVVRMAVAVELANRWFHNAVAGRPEEV